MIRPRLSLSSTISTLAALTLASGTVALLGWYLGPRAAILNSWASGIAMQPNTAACFAALGLALLLINTAPSTKWPRAIAALLASLAAFIGGATFIQHITGANFGIDTLLFAPTWDQKATASPGRMGPPASLCFVLIGSAMLLLIRGRALSTARTFALIVMAVSLVAVCGYIYGAPSLYSVPHLTGIAFNTAATLLILSTAVVASLPNHEPMRTLLADSAAGMMARRALPIIVLTPILVGFLRVEYGYLEFVFISTARTVVEVIGLAVLLWWALSTVRQYEQRVANHAEELARALEQRTQELTQSHEQLRRSETMAVLGALSAGFGHDLSNIVLPMRVRMQMLQQSKLDPEVRQHIDALAKNIEYISVLGNRVRQYMQNARANAVASQEQGDPEAVNLATWCREIQPFLNSILDASASVKLDCHIPEDLTHPKLDKTGLTQAAYNLVQNALKAIRKSRTGNSIRLAGYRNEQGDVCLCIEDDGPGMPPDVLAICTELTPSNNGHGLGLPLVKAFVDSHGGELRVYSPPKGKERGTAVVLRFPEPPTDTQSNGRPAPALNPTRTASENDDVPTMAQLST